MSENTDKNNQILLGNRSKDFHNSCRNRKNAATKILAKSLRTIAAEGVWGGV
jgi:hypothetical protein